MLPEGGSKLARQVSCLLFFTLLITRLDFEKDERTSSREPPLVSLKREEFRHYERYRADGVLIDLLFVLDPAEKALSILLVKR